MVGARIKEFRELKGISQKELAATLGINPTLMSKIEKEARPLTVKELSRLADFFNVTTDSLLGRSEAPTGISLSEDDEKLLRQYHRIPVNIQETIKEILAEYCRNN